LSLKSPNLLVIFAVFSAVPAVAQSPAAAEFESGAFAAAQANGQRILVEAYAPWCITCRLQGPAISKALQHPAATDIIVFRLTEANRKSDWRHLNIQRYGTLVAFSGYRETGRGVGAVSHAAVAEIVNSSRRESTSVEARNVHANNQKE